MTKRVNNDRNNLTKIKERELSESFIAETDAFLSNPVAITDHKTYREFFTLVAKCLLRSEVDTDFHFSRQTANAMVYCGTAIMMGLVNEQKGGLEAGLEQKYNELLGKLSGMSISAEEAALITKQQEMTMTIKILEKVVSNHTPVMPAAVKHPAPDIEDAVILPESNRIAARETRAVEDEQSEVGENEFPF